jgi:hypothetical protein
MNEADIEMLDQQIRMATVGAATNQELRGINFLLQKILLGQSQINERLDSIERTINPLRWERMHPEIDSDTTDEMF